MAYGTVHAARLGKRLLSGASCQRTSSCKAGSTLLPLHSLARGKCSKEAASGQRTTAGQRRQGCHSNARPKRQGQRAKGRQARSQRSSRRADRAGQLDGVCAPTSCYLDGKHTEAAPRGTQKLRVGAAPTTRSRSRPGPSPGGEGTRGGRAYAALDCAALRAHAQVWPCMPATASNRR